MIIIDGMDNTGKTTLAHKLADRFELPYLHSPSEYKYDFNRMFGWAIRELGSEVRAIYDRFSPITDMIYGPVLRGGTPYLTDQRGIAIRELLRSTPHIIIYCRPPRDVILDFGTREQMEGVIDHSVKLLESYDRYMHKLRETGHNIVVYDYTNPHGYDEVVESLEDFIDKYPRKGVLNGTFQQS